MKIIDFGWLWRLVCAISAKRYVVFQKQWDIRPRLLLVTNRHSHLLPFEHQLRSAHPSDSWAFCWLLCECDCCKLHSVARIAPKLWPILMFSVVHLLAAETVQAPKACSLQFLCDNVTCGHFGQIAWLCDRIGLYM